MAAGLDFSSTDTAAHPHPQFPKTEAAPGRPCPGRSVLLGSSGPPWQEERFHVRSRSGQWEIAAPSGASPGSYLPPLWLTEEARPQCHGAGT